MKKLSTVILTIVGLFLIFSAGYNTIFQIITLYKAKSSNIKVEEEIDKLEISRRELTGRIKEATSTAVINQQIRDKLGLGNGNDYRIIMPPVYNFENLYQKVNIGDEIPVWKQWWKLFWKK